MRLHFRRQPRLRRGFPNFGNTRTRATIGLPGSGTSLPTWSSPHAIGTGPIIGLLVIVGMILVLTALGG